jgi:hypothetical protein
MVLRWPMWAGLGFGAKVAWAMGLKWLGLWCLSGLVYGAKVAQTRAFK